MRGPLSNYMKVGIVHFMAYPSTMRGEGPILETVKKIATDEFFGAIEVTWMKDPEVKAKVRDLLAASHMTVGFGSQPPLLVNKYNLNHPDEAERRKAIDTVKASIDDAYFLGAGAVAFLAGKDPGDAERENAKKILESSIREILEYNRSKGGKLKVILETFDRNIEKCSVIGPSVEAAEFAARIRKDYPEFGLMLDLSHLPQLGEKPKEALRAVKDFLVHVHIGNAVIKDKGHPAYGDAHPRFGIPGGENDVDELAEFLEGLFEIGYLAEGKKELPVVAFEVKPVGDEDPDVVVANAKRTLLEAWARL